MRTHRQHSAAVLLAATLLCCLAVGQANPDGAAAIDTADVSTAVDGATVQQGEQTVQATDATSSVQATTAVQESQGLQKLDGTQMAQTTDAKYTSDATQSTQGTAAVQTVQATQATESAQVSEGTDTAASAQATQAIDIANAIQATQANNAASAAASMDAVNTMCRAPAKSDPVVSFSKFYGHPNASDAKWHDETWAFKQHGPISRLTLFKAWFYDGLWHDQGELKGVQTWYGSDKYTQDDLLLFGARKPHVPKSCDIYPGEAIVRAELQWDNIMRWMNYTTTRGRWCAWGFPDVPGTQKVVVVPPTPNMYLAAFRGYEGKPLPPSQGGYKKRYIVQIGFAWAERNCGQWRWNELDSVEPKPPVDSTPAVPATPQPAPLPAVPISKTKMPNPKAAVLPRKPAAAQPAQRVASRPARAPTASKQKPTTAPSKTVPASSGTSPVPNAVVPSNKALAPGASTKATAQSAARPTRPLPSPKLQPRE